MHRIFGAAGILFGLAFAIHPQGASREMDPSSKDEQELIRIEREFAEAAARRDSSFYGRYLADDFIGIDHNGQEMTKGQILERNKMADYELEYLRHENIRVRVHGDCAVALARTVIKGRFQGREFSGEYPYLRVWIKRNGRWLAVATQSTSVPQK